MSDPIVCPSTASDISVGGRRVRYRVSGAGPSVAMQVAVQAPHRVASLVLVDSAGFGREVTLTLRLLAIRPLGRLLLRRPSRLGARQVERSLFDDPALATDARIDHAYRLAQRPH